MVNSSVSYTLLGRIERFRGSALKAIEFFKSALEIDPNNQFALFWLIFDLNWKIGKPDLSKPYLKKLLEIDPLNPFNQFALGLNYWLSGDNHNALITFNNVINLNPELDVAEFCMAYVYAWDKQYNNLFSIIDQLEKNRSQDEAHVGFKGWLIFLKYAIIGEKSKALEQLNDETINFFWNDPDLPWFGAGGYALINENEEALRWLEHAISKGTICYPYLSEKDPFLENIRGEKRFKELMKHVKREWENFEL